MPYVVMKLLHQVELTTPLGKSLVSVKDGMGGLGFLPVFSTKERAEAFLGDEQGVEILHIEVTPPPHPPSPDS